MAAITTLMVSDNSNIEPKNPKELLTSVTITALSSEDSSSVASESLSGSIADISINNEPLLDVQHQDDHHSIDSGFVSADEDVSEELKTKLAPEVPAKQHTCIYCFDISQCPTNPINRTVVPGPRVVNKIWPSAQEAIADVESNSTVLAGGFGLCGIPDTLIDAVKNKPSITGLTVVSNNAGIDGVGLAILLATKQIRKMIASYVGENKTFERMYLSGELELELTPQGTLAERCRAGGSGIPAFYTPAAYGTAVQTGELPLRHNPDQSIAAYTAPREVRIFDGRPHVMEEAIKGDYAFVKAWKADSLGNCQFHNSAWNFNGCMGRNARCTIVEADHIVEPGEIDPASIHLPGIFVKRVVQATVPKSIEKIRYDGDGRDHTSALGTGEIAKKREKIVRRVAKEFKHGMYVNLGIGMPMIATSYVDPSVEVQLQTENGVLGLAGYPQKGREDPDLINAGKETVALKPGAACFGSEDSFAMIRSGRIDMTILGAMQVGEKGDLANWMLPGKVKGFGGAMDLVSNPQRTKVVVLTEHTDKLGRPKIMKQCTFPLTGKSCVSMIITELAVFKVHPTEGLTLLEIADGTTVEHLRANTGAPFAVSPDLKPMEG